MFNKLDDDFLDTTGMPNPIFKIMGNAAKMGSPIIEEEIQNHKNKLNNLITKLINTHNIDDETSINNEIKNETEFLSSLFKIKKNELNQINNNMNMNQMQQPMMEPQPMMQQQMMQQQMMQQQMMQQQMMQQQMMQQQIMQQQAQAQQAEMQRILNQPSSSIQMSSGVLSQSQGVGFCIIFRKSGAVGQVSNPIMVQCMPDEKVSEVIEKYRNKSGDRDPTKKFIFNARPISQTLTVAEAGLTNNANIFVVTPLKK